MKVFIISAMLVAAAMAAPSVIDNKVETDSSSNKMMQYFSSCFDADDTTNCLAVKGIAALNRAARASNIQVGAGFVLTKDPSYTRNGKALSENEIVASLPTDAEERSSRLYDMAADSVNEFFKSHSLQLKFPADVAQQVSRAIDEGRGKKKLKKLKKLLGPILLGLGSKIFALLPLFLVGLAFLAFKALIVSKIALVLAGVLAVSKMMSGGGGLGGLGSGLGILGKVAGLSAGAGGLLGGLGGLSGGSGAGAGYAGGATGATGAGYANSGSYANQGSTGGGWSSGGNSAYPYARSYDEDAHDAQDLAYNAHAAQTE